MEMEATNQGSGGNNLKISELRTRLVISIGISNYLVALALTDYYLLVVLTT